MANPNMPSRNDRGFSFIELLAYMAIAALLVLAAVPQFNLYRVKAIVSGMQNDVHNASLAAESTSPVDAVAASARTITLASTRTVATGSFEAIAGAVASTKTSDARTQLTSKELGGGEYSITATNPVTPIKVIYSSATLADGTLNLTAGINLVRGDGQAASPAPEPAPADGAAVMTSIWDTGIASGCSVITLPMRGTVNAQIDWGDGTKTAATVANPTHTYRDGGQRTIRITGSFTGWGATSGWPATCITAVTEWGATGTTSADNGFYGATNLVSMPTAVPSSITSMAAMFSGAQQFGSDISGWRTGAVTSMADMFRNTDVFDARIGAWDVSKVTDFSGMFRGARSFNQSLSGWDTSRATTLNRTFADAPSFNGAIGSWNVASVTDMTSTFDGAGSFAQDISKWDTRSATKMTAMLRGADTFWTDLSGWNVASVTEHANFATDWFPASMTPRWKA